MRSTTQSRTGNACVTSREFRVMQKLVNRLMSFNGVRLNPPASLDEIKEAEAQLGSELPQEVSDFYTLCNGIAFHECLDVPPLEQLVEYFIQMRTSPLFQMQTIILDEHESNPVCLFHT